jgi:hypothetical protein
MGIMRSLRVAMVVALTACAPPAVHPALRGYDPTARYASVGPQQFAATDPDAEPLRWQIGQRVLYKRRDAGAPSLEQLSVVARDRCGIWIEHWVHRGDARKSWLFCMHAQPAPGDPHPEDSLLFLVERRNREVLAVRDFRWARVDRSAYRWLVALVVVSRPAVDVARADVATPAGQFAQAAKTTDGPTTRWTHLAVPLGGVVREVTADIERVVVEVSTAADSSDVVELIHDLELAQRAYREVNGPALWAALRFGLDWLGTRTDLHPTPGVGGTWGMPVAGSLDVAVGMTSVVAATSTVDPALAESMLFVGAGVRWLPLGRTRIDRFGMKTRTWLYAQAELGYASLSRWSMDSESTTVGRGFALGASVGLNLPQRADWAIGIELHDHLALLNADEGLRHALGVNLYIQLFARPVRHVLPW